MIGLIIAFAVALVLSISLTPVLIHYLIRHQYGQFIRQDGPTAHMTKRGTPTMGGLVIILATVIAWLAGNLINGHSPSWSGWLLVFLFVGIGFIGLLDDALKIMHQRSLGLHAWAKIVGQVAIASLFTWGILVRPNVHGRTPGIFDISMTRPLGLTFTQWGILAAVVLIVIWVNFIVAAWSNAVNLTDGLDGLAAGAGIFVFVSYTFISYFQLLQSCWGDTVNISACYTTRDPLSIAIFCSSLVGALAVPVVECVSCSNLHGRYRLASNWCGARRSVDSDRHRVPCRTDRRSLRSDNALRRYPDQRLQDDPQTSLPYGSFASSL